jgi:hypothetical protein
MQSRRETAFFLSLSIQSTRGAEPTDIPPSTYVEGGEKKGEGGMPFPLPIDIKYQEAQPTELHLPTCVEGGEKKGVRGMPFPLPIDIKYPGAQPTYLHLPTCAEGGQKKGKRANCTEVVAVLRESKRTVWGLGRCSC